MSLKTVGVTLVTTLTLTLAACGSTAVPTESTPDLPTQEPSANRVTPLPPVSVQQPEKNPTTPSPEPAVETDTPDRIEETTESVESSTEDPLNEEAETEEEVAEEPEPKETVVTLTFDDGPGPWTDDVLEVLLEKKVTATFFALGSEMDKYPGVAAELVEAGMSVQSHTRNHHYLTQLSDADVSYQITSTDQSFVNAGLPKPYCVRPPYGDHDARVDAIVENLGKVVTTWNVDPQDWARPSSSKIVERVLTQVDKNEELGKDSVILLHDGGGDREQTIAALPDIIEELEESGYSFTTICGG